MNLSELAAHVCQLVGMNDTDDTAAAKMFLQRRLEMIWNTQLWRAAMLEATMTLGTDGTVDLADTLWLPSRGTLVLPPDMGSVLAVRLTGHTMNVATLESYYRTDADFLNMTGDPTQFQVLRPVVWEFENATKVQASGETVSIAYSENGVTKKTASIAANAFLDDVLAIYSGTCSGGTGAIAPMEDTTTKVTVIDAGTSALNGVYEFTTNNGSGLGIRIWTNVSEPQYVLQSLDGLTWYLTVNSQTHYTATQSIASDSPPLTGWGVNGNLGAEPAPSLVQGAATSYDGLTFDGSTSLRLRQRVRLTSIPTTEISVRVLGKMECPVLGDYDEPPLNNVEPCLLAFARGDMLMRQRQHGKAQLAQQEGAALLKQLADSEAYQQANSHRICPDGGYGEPSFNSPSHGSPFGY